MGFRGDILDFRQINRIGIISEKHRLTDNQDAMIRDHHKIEKIIDDAQEENMKVSARQRQSEKRVETADKPRRDQKEKPTQHIKDHANQHRGQRSKKDFMQKTGPMSAKKELDLFFFNGTAFEFESGINHKNKVRYREVGAGFIIPFFPWKPKQ